MTAGESAVVTSTVNVSDQDGNSQTATVTVTVMGRKAIWPDSMPRTFLACRSCNGSNKTPTYSGSVII